MDSFAFKAALTGLVLSFSAMPRPNSMGSPARISAAASPWAAK
jgi:hypothetical protein